MQVLRDLVLVAQSDETVSAPELAVLREIANGLDVPCGFVLHRCEDPVELD